MGLDVLVVKRRRDTLASICFRRESSNFAGHFSWFAMGTEPPAPSHVAKATDDLNRLMDETRRSAHAALEEWKQIQASALQVSNKLKPHIKLNIGGKPFTASKDTLLKYPESLFSALLGSEIYVPHNGVYFFDTDWHGFNSVLDALDKGELRIGKKDADWQGVRALLDFFHLQFVHKDGKISS
jgi:hypothetical protein